MADSGFFPLTSSRVFAIITKPINASIAQSVEQLIRNQQVVCSSHITSSKHSPGSCRKVMIRDFSLQEWGKSAKRD